MKNHSIFVFILTAITLEFANPVQAETLTLSNQVDNNPLTAQLFYPLASEKSTIQVIGKGKVTKAADSALLKFNFNANTSELPIASQAFQSAQAGSSTLTKETFKPIVDALIALGIPADSITVKIKNNYSGSSSFPFPFPSSDIEGNAQISVILEPITKERLKTIVDKVTSISTESKTFYLADVKVDFRVNNCEALERDAYIAAVKDAQNRAKAIATAVEAELVRVPSISEPFYNVFIPTCNTEGTLPFSQSSATYDPDTPVEVEITKDVFVTYTAK
jgi:uncharacterized protein YggE